MKPESDNQVFREMYSGLIIYFLAFTGLMFWGYQLGLRGTPAKFMMLLGAASMHVVFFGPAFKQAFDE